MSSNNKIAKNTLLLYIRMLLSMVITLYTSREVLNTLGVEDFGIYSIVAGVIIMFGFLNSAMAASTQRFLTFELGKGNQVKLQNIFNASMTIHIIIAIFIFLLAETVGLWFLNSSLNIPTHRMFAANCVYQFSVLTFVFNVVNVPYTASIIANERMGFYAVVGFLEVLLKLFVVFILITSSYDKLIFYSFLLLVVSVFIRFIDSIYCRRNFVECNSFKLIWDRDVLPEMGRFAGWNLFGVAAGISYNQGVNVLLNIFYGATINASRGIAYQVQGAVSNLVTNFQMASAPSITKEFAQRHYENSFRLVFKISKFSFFLLLFISIPLLIQTKTIITLWLKIVPEYTIIFTQLIIIDVLVNSLSGPLHVLIQATGNIKKYQIFVSGLLLLNLPTSYLFLKLGYTPEITVLTSIFYSFVALILRLIILKKNIDFPLGSYCTAVLIKVVVVGFISFLFPLIINNYLGFDLYSLILIFIIAMFSVVFSVVLIGLDSIERSFIITKIANLYTQSKNKFK
jgi:O-antigen/teichoic acid export membrane protein